MNQLLSMADSLDLEEEDISNFIEPTSSPFSRLFHEQEKMKVKCLIMFLSSINVMNFV